jgi:hydrogenase maturation factor
MCLGTVGRISQISQITEVGTDRCVQITAGGRRITGSLLAVSDPVELGDWVVVHSGLVLARLTEREALDALQVRESGARVKSEEPGAHEGK